MLMLIDRLRAAVDDRRQVLMRRWAIVCLGFLVGAVGPSGSKPVGGTALGLDGNRFGTMRQQSPPGPWSSSSAEQKQASRKVFARCATFGMMAAGDGEGHADPSKAVFVYLTQLCRYHSMPSDWPSRAKMRIDLTAEHNKLDAVLPGVLAPRLDEGIWAQ